ncbi:MAG: response regulator [Anaerolineae bacterium]|nr:response regulator [Anaerolineae bacterium]
MAEKILIVDDDVQTLRMVGVMLERQGYKILAASNGTQAITMARSEHPDLILLDVMMPDVDGFSVARTLRKETETADIPILMFTARAQVEDKIAGYEAGVDDYLTKPIHPAELTAHMRAILSRAKTRNGTPAERGYTIGVIGAKGGLGVSSLTLNLAINYYQNTKQEVIAAELRPGQGSWSTELGLNSQEGLNNLLRMNTGDVNTASISNELVRVPYGIRLLLASPNARDVNLMRNSRNMEAIVDNLSLMAKLTLLDIGINTHMALDEILNLCKEVLVVTEPFPGTINRTRLLIEDLKQRGFGKDKLLTLVIMNRIRADVQLSVTQVQEALGMPVSQVIPPAPEVSFQAATRNLPMIQVQIGGMLSLQYGRLAEAIAERVTG